MSSVWTAFCLSVIAVIRVFCFSCGDECTTTVPALLSAPFFIAQPRPNDALLFDFCLVRFGRGGGSGSSGSRLAICAPNCMLSHALARSISKCGVSSSQFSSACPPLHDSFSAFARILFLGAFCFSLQNQPRLHQPAASVGGPIFPFPLSSFWGFVFNQMGSSLHVMMRFLGHALSCNVFWSGLVPVYAQHWGQRFIHPPPQLRLLLSAVRCKTKNNPCATIPQQRIAICGARPSRKPEYSSSLNACQASIHNAAAPTAAALGLAVPGEIPQPVLALASRWSFEAGAGLVRRPAAHWGRRVARNGELEVRSDRRCAAISANIVWYSLLKCLHPFLSCAEPPRMLAAQQKRPRRPARRRCFDASSPPTPHPPPPDTSAKAPTSGAAPTRAASQLGASWGRSAGATRRRRRASASQRGSAATTTCRPPTSPSWPDRTRRSTPHWAVAQTPTAATRRRRPRTSGGGRRSMRGWCSCRRRPRSAPRVSARFLGGLRG